MLHGPWLSGWVTPGQFTPRSSAQMASTLPLRFFSIMDPFEIGLMCSQSPPESQQQKKAGGALLLETVLF